MPYKNARKLLKCLHQNKVGMDIEMSCRQMCALAMCARDDVDIADPLTWNKECVFGNCMTCKNPKIPFPNSIKNIEVSYFALQHGEKLQKTKKKRKAKIWNLRKMKRKRLKERRYLLCFR